MSMMNTRFPSTILVIAFFLAGCETGTSVMEEPANFEKFGLEIGDLSSYMSQNIAGKTSTKGVEGEAKGDVVLYLPGVGGREEASFRAESDDDEIKGEFHLKGFDVATEALLFDISGNVICSAFQEDGRSARFGGQVTASDVFIPEEFAYAIWTVKDNGETEEGKVVDLTSDLSVGYPVEAVEFHCEQGFEPFPFLDFLGCDLDPESALCHVSEGEIEVESEDYKAK